MSIKFEIPSIIEELNTVIVNSTTTSTTDLTITGSFILDGYHIDLTAGVTTNQILKYNGTSFIAVDDTSNLTIGTNITNALTGSVLFADNSSDLAQDNTNFIWNNSIKQLQIKHTGTDSPLFVDANTNGYSAIAFGNGSGSLISYVGYFNSNAGIVHARSKLALYSTGPDWVIANSSRNEFTFGMTDGATFFELANGSSAAVSSVNTGRIRYNSSTQHLEISENGSSYTQVAGGSGNLSGTLTAGLIPYATNTSTLANSGLTWSSIDQFLGIGQAAPVAKLDVLEANATSGNPVAFKVTGGAHTTLPASTEVVDINFNLNRTVQLNTGALGTQRAITISSPTYSFTGASTLTNAATLAIGGAPIAGTNATITNAYSFWVQGGSSRFDGDINKSDAPFYWNNTKKQILVTQSATDPADGSGAITLKNTLSSSFAQICWQDNNGTFKTSIGYSNTGTNMFWFMPSGVDWHIGTNGADTHNFKQDGTFGVGTLSPANRLSVNGAASFGTFATTTAPTNGLIVSGRVGIGTSTVSYDLDIRGSTSTGETIAIRTNQTNGYADLVWFDSNNSQKGGIGWGNSGVGATTFQSQNFFYTPSLDWVMSDGTTNFFRWYNGSSAIGFEMSSGSSATVSGSNKGKLRYNSSTQVFEISQNTASYDAITLLTTSQILTNKTLTSPIINGATSSGSTAIDFSGNSGAFKTSTGTNTIGGAVILNNASLSFVGTLGATANINFSAASATAQNLDIRAQNGSGVSSNGGNLLLSAGAKGSSGSDGVIRFAVNGTTAIQLTPAPTGAAVWQWAAGSTAVTFNQNVTSIATPGALMTIQAQNSSAASSTGGGLTLTSGTGTTTAGNLLLQTGGTTQATLTPTSLSIANISLGFFGTTAHSQPNTTGTTTGFTAGVGTNITDDATFTGGVGTTAYRISDIVLALKQLGLLAM